MADDERPEGLETKDTRGTLIGYGPAPVPHLNRTGSELDDDERRKADTHGDILVGGSGLPEGDADNGGITTASGGTQTKAAGQPSKAKATAAPKAQGPGGS